MKVKTTIKAGGIRLNHNEAQVRDRARTRPNGLKVKTNLKAGFVIVGGRYQR